jgi:hypothetical protein
LKLDTRVIGTDMFTKIEVDGAAPPGIDPDKWMRLDMTKLPPNNSLGLQPGQLEPAGAARFLKAAAKAEWVDDHRIRGTIDLDKADGPGGLNLNDVLEPEQRAKGLPFEATIDDEGRLTTMVLDVPAVRDRPAGKITTTYSDFGLPVPVAEPPANEVVEAPERVYGIFSA